MGGAFSFLLTHSLSIYLMQLFNNKFHERQNFSDIVHGWIHSWSLKGATIVTCMQIPDYTHYKINHIVTYIFIHDLLKHDVLILTTILQLFLMPKLKINIEKSHPYSNYSSRFPDLYHNLGNIFLRWKFRGFYRAPRISLEN